MEVSVCKHCKKVFMSKYKLYTCKECKQKDDDLFDRVIDYLKKFPNSNAIQISEALEVQAYEITKFLDEGRLEITKGSFEKM